MSRAFWHQSSPIIVKFQHEDKFFIRESRLQILPFQPFKAKFLNME